MKTDRRRPALERVGVAQFERYLVLIVAVFGVPYALQTLDSFFASWPARSGPVMAVSVGFGVASVFIGLSAAFLPDRSTLIFRAALAAYALGLAIWPFAIQAPVLASPMPWFVAMWPCEVAYIAVLSTRVVRPVLLAIAASGYVAVVLLEVGHLDLGDVFSNGFFMDAISVVMILLVRSIRHGVSRAGAAQEAALEAFGRSRIDDATEAERVRTDALVHDSVITTFLASADARTPDSQDLSRRMAANALGVLAHVNRAAEMGAVLPLRMALSDVSGELAPLLPHFDVQSGSEEDVVLPMIVCEALVGALLETMRNSVQHAGQAARRSVELRTLGADGIRIIVSDDGDGFEVRDALAARSALSESVVDRLRRVQGRADILSTPGLGTTVTLSWGSVVISGTEPLTDQEMGAVSA